jgi:hypothetical protein
MFYNDEEHGYSAFESCEGLRPREESVGFHLMTMANSFLQTAPRVMADLIPSAQSAAPLGLVLVLVDFPAGWSPHQQREWAAKKGASMRQLAVQLSTNYSIPVLVEPLYIDGCTAQHLALHVFHRRCDAFIDVYNDGRKFEHSNGSIPSGGAAQLKRGSFFKNAAAYQYGVVRLSHCCKYHTHLDADIKLLSLERSKLSQTLLPEPHWLQQAISVFKLNPQLFWIDPSRMAQPSVGGGAAAVLRNKLLGQRNDLYAAQSEDMRGGAVRQQLAAGSSDECTEGNGVIKIKLTAHTAICQQFLCGVLSGKVRSK